jgi:7-carboxy-7-deazaguanine synthase
VTNPEDVDEVDAVVREIGFRPNQVILMPQGTSVSELNKRGRWVANECVTRGYRFSTRLHIYLWGDKRGV